MIAGSVCVPRQTRVFPLKNNNFIEEEKKTGCDSYMTTERDDCIKTVHQITIKQYHTRGRGGRADGSVAAVMIFSRAAGLRV